MTGNYFRLLGISPALGRFFLAEEDHVPGRDPVAVIGNDLWHRRFGGDPRILGRTIRLNATDFTVVGVAPETFHGLPLGGLATDVWIPSAMFRVGYRYCNGLERGCNVVKLIGRLAPGRTIPEARAEMGLLFRQLAVADPETSRGTGLFLTPARGVDPEYRVDIARPAPLLAALAAVVLAIACANLAGLLLARATARRGEVAIRIALGATRVRLVRQLLTESLLLSLAGGALGLLVAFWASDVIASFYAADIEGRRAYFVLGLDPTVLAFATAASVATGILFGLTPAIESSRPDLARTMRAAAPGARASGSRLRDGLVVSQIALSLTLVTGAGLLVRSLRSVYSGPGFDPGPIVLLRLRPALVGYSPARALSFQREAVRRVEQVPGVVSASPADMPPLPGWGHDAAVWLPGREPARPSDALRAATNAVGPRYFETMGIALRGGRDFDDRDHRDTPAVAIVNETLARRIWPGESALGRSLVIDGEPHLVVGIANDAQYRLALEEPAPFLYTDFWQKPSVDSSPVDARLHVRVSGDPSRMLERIRREIAALDPDVAVSEDRPLTEWLDYSFAPVRMARAVLVSFGALGLFLGAVGLYGVLAFSVARRSREIAIRIALGADARRVAGSVARRALALTLAGAGLGLLGALAAGRLAAGFLYGVPAADPLTILAAIAVLFAAAVAATYFPARRAARVDPMTALRSE